MAVHPGGRLNRWVSTAARICEMGYLRRRRIATAGVALLIVMVAYHVVFGQNGLTAFRQKRMDERQLDDQLKLLTDENERLKAHVDRLKQDPNAIEHEARESLHYTRPGEVIYTMPETPKSHN